MSVPTGKGLPYCVATIGIIDTIYLLRSDTYLSIISGAITLYAIYLALIEGKNRFKSPKANGLIAVVLIVSLVIVCVIAKVAYTRFMAS